MNLFADDCLDDKYGGNDHSWVTISLIHLIGCKKKAKSRRAGESIKREPERATESHMESLCLSLALSLALFSVSLFLSLALSVSLSGSFWLSSAHSVAIALQRFLVACEWDGLGLDHRVR